jgi:hypothetical protein
LSDEIEKLCASRSCPWLLAAVDNIATLKKGDMATHAADVLAGTGWLPAMLRPHRSAAPTTWLRRIQRRGR